MLLIILKGGVQHVVQLEEIAHGPERKEVQGDEEEGSPFHHGAHRNIPRVTNPGTGKIERSAEALREYHLPTSFPSKKRYVQILRVTGE
jgi:hypothetical protein